MNKRRQESLLSAYRLLWYEVALKDAVSRLERTICSASYLRPLNAMLAWILHKVHLKRAYWRCRLSRATTCVSAGIVSNNCTITQSTFVTKLSLLRGKCGGASSNWGPRERRLKRNASYDAFTTTEKELPLVCSPPFHSTYTCSHPPRWLLNPFDANRPQAR